MERGRIGVLDVPERVVDLACCDSRSGRERVRINYGRLSDHYINIVYEEASTTAGSDCISTSSDIELATRSVVFVFVCHGIGKSEGVCKVKSRIRT